LTITKDEKQKVLKDYRLHDTDTGSVEVQVALITARINELTKHLQLHVKDHHSRFGLMKMVGQRRRLLEYLKRTDLKAYRTLIENLDLRK
jgi:small subunit ribosomal protein S15